MLIKLCSGYIKYEDIKEGDLVIHRLTGDEMIVQKIYSKLNEITVIDKHYNVHHDSITSFTLLNKE